MKKKLILFYIFIAFTPSFVFSAGSFEAGLYQDNTGESLNYRIYIPNGFSEKPIVRPESGYPLLLFFHGSGRRGRDNLLQLVGGPRAILKISKKMGEPVIIVVPQCPRGQQWVNTPRDDPSHRMEPEPSQPMRLTIELLEKIMNNYPVDSRRIYTAGFSMGGFAVWDILQRMPDTFAAGIPVCGGGDEDLALLIKNIPIWIFHGDRDTVVPTDRSRSMAEALRVVGGTPLYTEYPDTGHNSWSRTFSDAAIIKWLFEQKKQ